MSQTADLTARTPSPNGRDGAATPTVVVRPGARLSGTVRVDGSKNAALPLLACAAVTGRPVEVSNTPSSADVGVMLTLLELAGFGVDRAPADRQSVTVRPPSGRRTGDLERAGAIRASYYLVPALLAAHGRADLPWPGGCRIGDRGMDLHFDVYAAFGDSIDLDSAGYHVTAHEAPAQVTMALPFRSRGASVVAALRAVVARVPLKLGNPNLSPEFTGTLDALRSVGWCIDLHPSRLRMEPPHDADDGPVSWRVPGDKIEAGTLACAITATGGTGRIEGVAGRDVAYVARLLDAVGVRVLVQDDALLVLDDGIPTGQALRAISSLDPGGLDADFEPALMALALRLPGTHEFSDTINPGRHGNLLSQLARLGADIEALTATTARLNGPQHLAGGTAEATDIRTGSALLIAALTAHDETTVTGLTQLRRGYADLPGKLRALGADLRERP
jgi:UDP-N-acetylglucosamine 1-carboxyvinyltransferase